MAPSNTLGKPKDTVFVSLSFPTDEDHDGNHLPPNECYETCFVSVRNKDNPDRQLRPNRRGAVANRISDLPEAVKKALSAAGFKIHEV